MTDDPKQTEAISPPLMPDTPQAIRARQGVVSFRILTILLASTALAAAALSAVYVLS